LVSESALELE
jgi:hypothetical protein